MTDSLHVIVTGTLNFCSHKQTMYRHVIMHFNAVCASLSSPKDLLPLASEIASVILANSLVSHHHSKIVLK
jgi:hypothetical protein